MMLVHRRRPDHERWLERKGMATEQLGVVKDSIRELGKKREASTHADLEERVGGHVATLRRELDLVKAERAQPDNYAKLADEVASLRAHATQSRRADSVEDRLQSLADDVRNLPQSLRSAPADARGRKLVIQRRFNVGVLEATLE